jgi:hypothetical protein
LKDELRLHARLRSYLDGDFDYFLEEDLFASDHYRFRATYRWQKSYHDDIGPLYILMEATL